MTRMICIVALLVGVGLCLGAEEEKKTPASKPKSAATQKKDFKTEPSEDPLKDKLWERFTDDEQKVHVERLKAAADDVKQKLGLKRLKLYETKHLLFYTDLNENEAKRWQAELVKMYKSMLKMFGMPEETNVWRGKAVIYVFQTREDFVRYESEIEKVNVPPRTAGMCHSGGDVRIAFYRQADVVGFATVLVHESSHGFIHRYRTRVNIPDWVNEGMAEWIAYDILSDSRWQQGRIAEARKELEARGSTQDMFNNWIGEWQYGVAYTLTHFMINNGKARYVKFINAIKDGKDWEKALEEDYGTTLDRLVAAYGKWMGIGKPLRP